MIVEYIIMVLAFVLALLLVEVFKPKQPINIICHINKKDIDKFIKEYKNNKKKEEWIICMINFLKW